MKNSTLKIITVIILTITVQLSAGQAYVLPELNYDYDALEPYIDAATMEIHHQKHHNAYVTNLNNAIKGSDLEKITLEEKMLMISRLDVSIRNNGGGHYNHNLFWEIMSPNPKAYPEGILLEMIVAEFGSIQNLLDELTKASLTRFGSGWGWLIITPERKLKVVSTANQDNPLMDTEKIRGLPIIGIDVWEHAYYLKFQNRRAEYLRNFFAVLDWAAVEKRLESALDDPLLQRLK